MKAARQNLIDLGVLVPRYGSKRGTHLSLDPDAAEQLSHDLIIAAAQAREENERE